MCPVLFCACQNNEDFLTDDNTAEGTTEVTVKFEFPSDVKTRAASRAYGDGMTVNQIKYAVYRQDATKTPAENLVCEDVFTITDPTLLTGSFVIPSLSVGDSFDFVFWADHSDGQYTFNAQTATVDMNYRTTDESGSVTANENTINCNNEKRDAFFNNDKKGIRIERGMEISIVLKRPFAQLNIGTSDLAQAGSSLAFDVAINDVYPTLNLLNGHAEGTAVSVLFKCSDVPHGETFPVSGYDYICMNYLLIRADDQAETLVEKKVRLRRCYSESSAETIFTLSNVPFKRNYRTNIYGQLLTTGMTVLYTIQPGFDGEYNNAGGLVSSKDELLTALRSDKSDITLQLGADIKLDTYEPITKKVTLDLAGHSITTVGSTTGVSTNWPDNFVFYVTKTEYSSGELIINDTQGEGGTIGSANNDYAIGVDESGILTIRNGHITGKKGAVLWMDDDTAEGMPTITILGGHYSAFEADENGNYRVLDFESSVDSVTNWGNTNPCRFVVKGGYFENFNPANAMINSVSKWGFLCRVKGELDSFDQSVGKVVTVAEDGAITYDHSVNPAYAVVQDGTIYHVTYDQTLDK